MKDRIAHIMRAKNLKASDFAALLGIQPSGVSHILAGRNNPSLEFIKKIKETFPEYNLDWIIFGTGPMTTSEPFKESIKETPTPPSSPSGMIPFDYEDPVDNSSLTEPIDDLIDEKPRSGIKSMLILYEDGTFDSYMPR